MAERIDKMDKTLVVGIKGTMRKIVEDKDTAMALGSGNIDVFSTPSMIALMELTARMSVQDYLLDTQTTVGTKVNIAHLKASPVGSEIVCESELILFEGRRLVFRVEASMDNEPIGEGTHERYIVDVEKFLKSVYKNTGGKS